jgi:hypothetical protein
MQTWFSLWALRSLVVSESLGHRQKVVGGSETELCSWPTNGSPPSPGRLWAPDEACHCFLKEFSEDNFTMCSISFMPQDPIVGFWPRSYFKLSTVKPIVTKNCQSNSWYYGDIYKNALSFPKELLALKKGTVVALSTMLCASASHRKFCLCLHAFMTIYSFCNWTSHYHFCISPGAQQWFCSWGVRFL